VAAGVLESFPKAAADWARTGDTTAPEPELTAHLAERLPRYEKLLASLTELS
jgi:hypothetical protein